MTPYTLTNSNQAKATLVLGEVKAQQQIMVNLTVQQAEAINSSSIQLTHTPAETTTTWKLVGDATVDMALKAGDKLQVRLINSSGEDIYIPAEPVLLNAIHAKPENWAAYLAGKVNVGNRFSAKIGVLTKINNTEQIKPEKSPSSNKIYVLANRNITNAYIRVISADKPNSVCVVKRQESSGSYWLGYNIFTDNAPIILNFSNTGIDLRQLSIDSGNFAGIHIIDKDHLKIDKKPEWVTQSVPGYIGFHEQNRQSYTPFNHPSTASCVPQ